MTITLAEFRGARSILLERYESHKDDLTLAELSEYVLSGLLPSQVYGPAFAKALIREFGWCDAPRGTVGDAVKPDGTTVEIKFSTHRDGRTPVANFVQLRPHENVDETWCVYLDDKGGFTFFVLSPEQLRSECTQLAHGTPSSTSNNSTKEYRVSLPWVDGNPSYDRWMALYSV